MALVVEQNFVNKYKDQYYSDSKTTEELHKQQQQLFKILDDLHAKTQKYFQKLCESAERKGGQSLRNSISKQNTRLPIIVDAEIKNTKTYRQLLENQKAKLEKRMALSMNLKEHDMNEQIKQEKQKVLNIIKKNKLEKLEIKKLGDKLTEQKKSPKQILNTLLLQLKTKKNENLRKMEKLQANQARINELDEKIIEINYSIQQNQQNDELINNQATKQLEAVEKLEVQHKILSQNRDKLKQNIQSHKTRLSQQYYCKLKQLQGMIKKNEQLSQDIENCQIKIKQFNNQLTNSRFFA